MAASTGARRRGRPVTTEKTRGVIRDTAVALMREKGYAGMSIQHLADMLAFSKPTFYYHVKNKADLLRQISLETLELAQTRISAIARSGASPSDRMRQIVCAYVDLMTQRQALFGVYFEERTHLQAVDLARTREAERDLLHLIEGVYREGVASAEFRDMEPSIAVFGILGMCFWVYQWYRADGSLPANQIAETLADLAAEGYRIHRRGDLR